MLMLETDNKNFAHVVGQEVKTSHLYGEMKRFDAADGTAWESEVKRIYRTGNEVTFVTKHSTYRFQLNINEKLVMGVTVEATRW